MSSTEHEGEGIRCEVAYLNCTKEGLKEGVSYVVSLSAQKVYQLFAEEKWLAHESLASAMIDGGKLSDMLHIRGGGTMFLRESAGALPTVTLDDFSHRFGAEPEEVRQALRPLVISKLQELGIDVN